MWANTYESLGDVCGRGIRYGEPITQESNPGVDPALVREAVQTMQELSAAPATTEQQWQESSELPITDQQMLNRRTGAIAIAQAITAAVLTIEGKTGEDGG